LRRLLSSSEVTKEMLDSVGSRMMTLSWAFRVSTSELVEPWAMPLPWAVKMSGTSKVGAVLKMSSSSRLVVGLDVRRLKR